MTPNKLAKNLEKYNHVSWGNTTNTQHEQDKIHKQEAAFMLREQARVIKNLLARLARLKEKVKK